MSSSSAESVVSLPLVAAGVGLALASFATGFLVSRQATKPEIKSQQQPVSVPRPERETAPKTQRASSSTAPAFDSSSDDDDNDDDSEDSEYSDEENSSSDEEGGYPHKEEHKLVLVVCTNLKMKPGKVAAQCCHAAVGAYKRALRQNPEAVRYWERTAAAKIALKVPSQEDLVALQQAAKAAGLPNYLVVDAGRTQIPGGSRTVLGIGPAPKSFFGPITGHLQLY